MKSCSSFVGSLGVRLLLLLGSLTISQAATITWTNTGGGVWNTAANWSPNQVPGDTDTVIITHSGTYQVDLDANATVTDLLLGGAGGTPTLAMTGQTLKVTGHGTVTTSGRIALTGGSLNGTLTLAGLMHWTEGQLNGALTVAAGGVLNLAGDAAGKQLNGVLTNAGTVNYTGAGFLLAGSYGGGVIYNLAGGRFDLQTDQLINWSSGNEVIYNAGQFLKSQGSGIALINPIFNNTGSVEARSGGIQFQNGGLMDGALSAADNAAIALGGGSFTFAPGANFTGAGSHRLIGGNLVCAGLGSALDLSHLELTGGNLMVDGALANLTLKGTVLYGTNATISGVVNFNSGVWNGTNRITGTLNWTEGQLNGALTVAGGGVLNLAEEATKQLFGVLTNAGTVNYTGAGLLLVGSYGGGVIYNLAGGRFDLQTDQLINWNFGNEVINNAGLFLKSQGSGIALINPLFNNTGSVEARSGGIQFQNGGLMDGALSAADSAAIALGGGSFAFAPGANFTGAGSHRLIGGNLVCAGLGSALDLSHLELSGGNLMVDGALANLTLKGTVLYGTNATISGVVNFNSGVWNGTNRITGTLNWTEGQLNGALTVADGGVLNLAEEATKQLFGVLTNAGTVNYTGAGFLLVGSYGGGVIYNLAGGRFDLQTDQVLNWSFGNEVIHNAGLFLKSQGSNITTVYPVFNNTGVVEARSGGIAFQSGGLMDGTLTAADNAAIALAGGSFTFAPGANFTGAGSHRLIGGNLVCAGLGSALDLSRLELTGGNLLVDGALANLTLKGTVFYGTNATISGVVNFNSGVWHGTNRITGTLNWTEGQLNGALTVADGGVLNLAEEATKQLFGVLTNAGTVNYLGAGLLLVGSYGGGVIYNLAGGQFDLQTDQVLNWSFGNEVIHNAGLFLKSQGSNITAVYPVFNNTGVVEARTGGIAFQSGGLMDGTLTAADRATITLAGGSFTFAPGYGVSGAGFVGVAGGAVTLNGTMAGALGWTGGTISGTLAMAANGSLNLAGAADKILSATLTNAGSVVMAGTGNLLVQGRYSERPSASLIISLGGTVPGVGSIQFTTPPSFCGRLLISSAAAFRPNPGASVQVLNFPSAGGHFSCLDGLDFGQGLRWDPLFSETSLTLTAATYPANTLPILRAYPSLNSVCVTWPAEFRGWKLYATTNLALSFGTLVPVVGTNNTVVEPAEPREFFRLVKQP